MEVGDQVELGDYVGPNGTVAIIQTERVPENALVFIKDSIIVAILYAPMTDITRIPVLGSYDGLLCHPNGGPRTLMGEDWIREAAEEARKKYFQ